MLKLTGNIGKSVIVDAIKKYNDARVYSYDKELIPVMESYHVNSDECSIKEFCEYILEDIDSLSSEQLPVNMVVIYTNLTDKHDITIVEDYANTLEFEYKSIDSVITAMSFASLAPVFFRQSNFATKFLSPKISSQSSFKGACSLSSIEINITPLSASKFLAIFKRLFINDNHLEWR